MRRLILIWTFITVVLITLSFGASGCFVNSSAGSNTSNTTSQSVVIPAPEVVSVVASTSGTESAYYATLDIKVKNNGAEGTILVKATMTQNGKSNSNEMPVFLKQNQTQELKLTFPLVWMGGEFTSKVETVIP
jgi:hypothetical protein